MDAQNGSVELKQKPWKVCRPVVAGSHHFTVNPEPHLKVKRDPDSH